jgi:hypothetical protein
MLRPAVLIAAAALVLPLAGCTQPTSPEPAPSSAHPSAPVTASASASASPTELRVPPHTAAEILRSTVTTTSVREEAADTHGVHDYDVAVACTGPAGATMAWRLEDAKGRLEIGSTADCSGSPEGAGWTSPGAPPAALQIALVPHGSGVTGYAILSRR